MYYDIIHVIKVGRPMKMTTTALTSTDSSLKLTGLKNLLQCCGVLKSARNFPAVSEITAFYSSLIIGLNRSVLSLVCCICSINPKREENTSEEKKYDCL